MSQQTLKYVDPPLSGAALIAATEAKLQSLASSRSGTSRPPDVQVGEEWLDTTTSTAWIVKRWDGTEDISLYTINPTTHAQGLAAGFISGTVRAIAGTNTTTAMSPQDCVAQQLANPVAATAGGTANSLTATIAAAPQTALADRMRVRVRAGAANTGAATLDLTLGTVDTGAVPVRKDALAPLEAGDIAGAGHELELQYNAMAGAWLLLNPAATSSGSISSTTLNILTHATFGGF